MKKQLKTSYKADLILAFLAMDRCKELSFKDATTIKGLIKQQLKGQETQDVIQYLDVQFNSYKELFN